MKIAFDVGGCISKFPDVFRPLLMALSTHPEIEVYVISDMHPENKIVDMLERNGFGFLAMYSQHRVYSADYMSHGEQCKAVLCAELGIDVLVDDFPGYVATVGSPLVRLLVMPDPTLDYYHPTWILPEGESTFGRRNPPESKRPQQRKTP